MPKPELTIFFIMTNNSLTIKSFFQEKFKTHFLGVIIVATAFILFFCSSLRHFFLRSGAYDLGFFDQTIYLISQGKQPIISFWGYHILGGHGDWIVYFIALLYKIYPSVYWLFGLQAVSLSIGVLPTFYLALQAGLQSSQAKAIAIAYLLYPVIFHVNLFDFHPEVIALPAMLAAVLAARQDRIGWFCLAIIVILGCRDALSLNVAAMGLWLLVFEKKRWCGAIALTIGIAWFLIVTQVIIPHFRPDGVESVVRYSYLGKSIPEIVLNIFLKPGLVFGQIFSWGTGKYLLVLLLPIIWGLSPKHLLPLISAIPTLAMNILANSPAQRDLAAQYSVPIVPFLFLAVISSLAGGQSWLQTKKSILLWSLVCFLVLGRYKLWIFAFIPVDNWQATSNAIAQVDSQCRILTTFHIIPHLAHRPVIELTHPDKTPVGANLAANLAQFDCILLNVRNYGWPSNLAHATNLKEELTKAPEFELVYQQDEVFLFKKKN